MRRWLVITSLAVHFVVITALFIAGFWRLEQLDPGKTSFSLHDVALPPPPASAGGPVKVAEFTKKQPKKIVHELVQTRSDVSPTPAPTPADTSNGGGDGSGSGSGSGSDGDTGTCTENCGPPTSETKDEPKPEPEKKVPPKTVTPTVMLGLRVSGETQIQPPDLIKTTMQHAGDTRVTASFMICLDTGGGVTSVKMIASSKYAEYDAVLSGKIHDWRYRPYMVNNQPIPVCGVVTFIYRMK